MKAKKGISLIVLVITIIVIIILAAAVILTLNNNNPIVNAKEATVESDKSEIQSSLTLLMSKIMVDVQDSIEITPGTGGAIEGSTFTITGSGKEIAKVDDKYVKITGSETAYAVVAEDLGISATKLADYTVTNKGIVQHKTATT